MPSLRALSLWFAASRLAAVGAAPVVHKRQSSGPTSPESGSPELLGPNGNTAAPASGATLSKSSYELVAGQTADGETGLYLDFTSTPNPQPIRGSRGAVDSGPRNYRYDAINSDIFAPPATDSGDVANAVWPMGLSHNRGGLDGSGWARQQNQAVLPDATAMAGVNMHLSPGAYRELHWHTANEWAYIFNGSVRVQASNEAGATFVDDLVAGDVWYFPSGIPHSIQALDNGTEFLLIFDDGEFSEEETFLASELFERQPKAVLAKNLQTDVSAFDNLPDGQLWIFPGTPAPADIGEQSVTGPAGFLAKNDSYSYHFSQQPAYDVAGGSVKILDPTAFPIAAMFSAALVTIKPGAMRELHWHLDSDEWNFFLAGSARITVFQAPQSSRTFDYAAGSVGYIPQAASHYIENTGATDLVLLEVLQAPKFTDISVNQWLGLTPAQIVRDTLHLPDDVIANLPKTKQYIVPGNPDLTTTNFTREA